MEKQTSNTLAFCLFKYFPYGGLERDMVQIAQESQLLGWNIRVYTMSWEGDIPKDFDIHILPKKGLTNHERAKNFHAAVCNAIKQEPVAGVIGFNKMPDLDVYYAADICFKEKAEQKGFLYKFSNRYRIYAAFEEAVFGENQKTEILMISKSQEPFFLKHYKTPLERMHYLPPNITRDRVIPVNASDIRNRFRSEFNISDDEKLILLIGSGFQRKGVDRAIMAIAALPESARIKAKLFIIGKDKPDTFHALAKKYHVDSQVNFLGGRKDVPNFLLGADILIHPARSENTGTVLLEAVASGLPVLCTEVCGYSHYIKEANAGLVTPEPFSQETLNKQLQTLLSSDLQPLRESAIHFAKTEDIYGMAKSAAEIINTTIRKRLHNLT